MNSLIMTFSLTGYTKKTAECIRDGFVSAEGGPCELVDIADVDTSKLKDYDLVGIGCPVYYYQEPFHIRDFIKNLPELKDKHWFVFCSHGSVMGVTLNSMADCLRAKGVIVVGYYDIYADACAPFIPYPTYTSGHPDKQEYDEARAFGKELAEKVPRIMNGEMDLIPAPKSIPDEWVNTAKTFTPEFSKMMIPEFTINKDKCTECHKCEEKCAVNGIDVSADPPRVQNPCIYCCNCVMECPNLAIEADWSGVMRVNLIHYPDLLRWLTKAEAAGEFRWLMDPDSLNLDDCMYFQRKRELENK